MLLEYSFKPRPNNHALDTADSVMDDRFINKGILCNDI